jgi:thiol-disulfide isomerase/thioredoxin
MESKRWPGILLNIATAVAVAGALYLVTTERLIPAWDDRAVVRVGETVTNPVELHALGADSSITLPLGRPVMLSVYRSTCPACKRAVPGWLELADNLRGRAAVVAVALEDEESGLAYARREMPGADATRPASPSEFVDQFDIQAVPTTLLFDGSGRLVAHRTGPLEPAEIRRLAELVR